MAKKKAKAAKKGTRKKPPASKDTRICPQYAYADHGSFWSYYALLGPGCGSPRSWDGPPSLPGLPRPCWALDGDPDHLKCFSMAKSSAEHATDPDYERWGLAAGAKPARLFKGAKAKNVHGKKVRVVRFCPDPKTAASNERELAVAHVVWVQVAPKDFDPQPDWHGHPISEPIERGHGGEVAADALHTAIDADVLRGEVETLGRVGHCVTIAVTVNGIVRTYHVLMKRRPQWESKRGKKG